MKTSPQRPLFYKRYAALMLAFLLVFAAVPALAASEFAVIYNTNSLNLREEPSTSSTRLGTYSPGTWIEILGDAPGNWYEVLAPDGKTGYMSRNFLNKGTGAYVTVGTVLNPKASQFLNLRKSPSYSAQVLGIYYNGVPALILKQRSDGWYYVSVDGVKGYFRKEFLKLDAVEGSDDIATIVTPNNTGLNLRDGPGMQYSSLRQFKGGKYVMVLARGDNWWKVSIDGYTGYMSSDFLKDGILSGGSSSSPIDSKDPYALVKNPKASQVLNLREEPTTSSQSIGQYKNGTRVTVLDQGSEWSHVTVDSAELSGFMMAKYLAFYNLPKTPTLTVDHPNGTFVNLRNGPGMTGTTVLTKVKDGAKVEVLIPDTEWVKVRYGKYVGYMAAGFLK